MNGICNKVKAIKDRWKLKKLKRDLAKELGNIEFYCDTKECLWRLLVSPICRIYRALQSLKETEWLLKKLKEMYEIGWQFYDRTERPEILRDRWIGCKNKVLEYCKGREKVVEYKALGKEDER